MIPALLFVAVRAPLVAFAARFYSTDSRPSRFQVYVCDLSGRRLRQITRERTDCGSVRWDGPNRIVYSLRSDMKEVDLKTGRTKTLLRVPHSSAWLKADPGRFSRGPGEDPIFLAGGGLAYAVHAGRVRKLKVLESRSLRLPLKTSLGTIDDSSEGLFLERAPGDVTSLAIDTDDLAGGLEEVRVYNKNLFFIQASALSTWGTSHHLVTVRGDRAVELASGVELDADLDRKWIGWVTHRELANAPKIGKHLWVSRVGVTDWRTGKSRVLVKGLVWADSISLSPGVP